MKASDRGRNVKSKELFGCFDKFSISMLKRTCSRVTSASSGVNNGSMGRGSVGKMGQFLDGSYGSWVYALSPMTHLHIYRKHVVKATFVVGDN